MGPEHQQDRPLGALPARPRAVLLDAFGTLVALAPPGERLRAALARDAGVDVGTERAAAAFQAEIAFYLDHHLEGHDDASLETLRDACAGVLHDALGEPGIERGVVRAAMLEALRFDAFADVVPALQLMRRGGLRLVVASNWDCSLPQALADARLLHMVDGVVASAVAGAAKPDEELFAAALEVAGVAAGEAIHVGDSLDRDVAGAMVSGIAPVLLARDGAGNGPPPPGVPVIRSLIELPAALGAAGRMLGEG